MSDALTSVELIYFAMQTNLNMMLSACHTQDERDQVMTKYVAARQNFYQCINKVFHDDDPTLKALVAEANKNIAVLKDINKELGNIAKVIADLTQGVTIGAQIVTKIVAL